MLRLLFYSKCAYFAMLLKFFKSFFCQYDIWLPLTFIRLNISSIILITKLLEYSNVTMFWKHIQYIHICEMYLLFRVTQWQSLMLCKEERLNILTYVRIKPSISAHLHLPELLTICLHHEQSIPSSIWQTLEKHSATSVNSSTSELSTHVNHISIWISFFKLCTL